jgi:glycosyltransferase involved in cell wall biosynthesis
VDSDQFHDLVESGPPLMRCSIIIPTYNRASYLDVAINSVLSQMLPDDELIVIDDGSEDETPAVLSRYGNRIAAIQGGHGGAGRARNLGIARASGDLVAFLDSDDCWFPQKLRIQRDFMARRPDVLFSFTNFEVQFRDGSVRPRYLELWHRDHATWEEVFGPGLMYSAVAPLPEGIPDFPVYEGDLYRPQLTGFYVLTDTLVARRKEAGDALHFAEDLKTYEDLECFYRLSQRGRAAFLDVETVRQLDHPNNRLSQLASIDKIDARLTLMRRIWGADAAFLQQHSSLYSRSHDALLLQKAGLLLSQGANRMARRTLAEMSSPPAFLTLLSHLPGWLTARALELRRRGRDH